MDRWYDFATIPTSSAKFTLTNNKNRSTQNIRET